MYVIIFFKDGRKIKRKGYTTSSAAYFDYLEKGCIYVELFNKGVKISSIGENPIVDIDKIY